MDFIGAGLIYFGILLVAALAVPRWLPALRTERGILRLHLGSFATVVVVAISYAAADPAESRISAGFAVVAGHAIFSLSFLELWSLTEGGYSVQILLALAARPRSATALAREFAEIGEGKQRDRIAALQRLGLVSVSENGFMRLTPKGRVASRGVKALLMVPKMQGNA